MDTPVFNLDLDLFGLLDTAVGYRLNTGVYISVYFPTGASP